MRVFRTCAGVLLLALSATTCSDRAERPDACMSSELEDALSCVDALRIARAVAESHDVDWTNVSASIRPQAVAEGQSVTAWFVTVDRPVYWRDGERCVAESYTVVLDATTGRLLARDVLDASGCD